MSLNVLDEDADFAILLGPEVREIDSVVGLVVDEPSLEQPLLKISRLARQL